MNINGFKTGKSILMMYVEKYNFRKEVSRILFD